MSRLSFRAEHNDIGAKGFQKGVALIEMVQGPCDLLQPGKTLLRSGRRIFPRVPERPPDRQLLDHVPEAAVQEGVEQAWQHRMFQVLQQRTLPVYAWPSRLERNRLGPWQPRRLTHRTPADSRH